MLQIIDLEKNNQLELIFRKKKLILRSIRIGRHSFVPFGHSKILPNKRPFGIVSVLFDVNIEALCRASNARGAPT